MSPNCELRRSTTATPQSLMLLNSDFALKYSKTIAERVAKIHPDSVETQLKLTWNLIYGHSAENSEIVAAMSFVKEQSELLKGRLITKEEDDAAKSLQTEAFANLCQMLLSSNEFLYVE